jgi:hypothetical protein
MLVIAVLFSPAKWLDALDEDLAVGRVGVAEELHRFGNIVSQRHSVGVARLLGPAKFRLHVRRGKFEDLHGRFP